MSADWDAVFDRLRMAPLAGDLQNLVLKAGLQDPDHVATWKLLISLSPGPEQQRRALRELCRLEPEQESWRTQLASLPAVADTEPLPARPRFRVAWGTRLAVWAAILSMLCVFAIAYFHAANQESLLQNERPVDLLWFTREREPQISSETQRITQRLAELDQRSNEIQSSLNSLMTTARVQNGMQDRLHQDVASLQNLLKNADIRQVRFETESQASAEQVAQQLKSIDVKLTQLLKPPPRPENPIWEWFWQIRSPQ